jgi:hypothetical protein
MVILETTALVTVRGGLIMQISLRMILNAVGFLSLIDLILTALGLKIGIIDEGNPFMKNMLEISPVLFVTLKIALTLFFLIIISKYGPNYEWTKPAVSFVLVAYLGVMILHMTWIIDFVTT